MTFIFRHPSFYKKLKAKNKSVKTDEIAETDEIAKSNNSFNQPSSIITNTTSSTATTKTKRIKKI